jgi:hypothetical protein
MYPASPHTTDIQDLVGGYTAGGNGFDALIIGFASIRRQPFKA